MGPFEKARDRLKRATFKIAIEPVEQRRQEDWWWGTGFWISKDGYALTAFHNFPEAAKAAVGDNSCIVLAYLDAGPSLELQCLPSISLPEKDGDIGVMKLVNASPAKATDVVEIGRVMLQDDGDRKKFWAGRHVCTYGFPVHAKGPGQGEREICGDIDSFQPLEVIDIKRGPDIIGRIECLRFRAPERARELSGISGAPILDCESGLVLAVAHHYDPDQEIIYGTEIMRLETRWPAVTKWLKDVVPLPTSSFVLLMLPEASDDLLKRLKQIIAKCGFTALLPDEFKLTGNPVTDVTKAIIAARVIIIDVSNSLNAMYVLGIAQCYGSDVLVIAKEGKFKGLPFSSGIEPLCYDLRYSQGKWKMFEQQLTRKLRGIRRKRSETFNPVQHALPEEFRGGFREMLETMARKEEELLRELVQGPDYEY
jgi:hypothetical protein